MRQKQKPVLFDPCRNLLTAIIKDAVRTVRSNTACVTECDRYAAEQFLRGEKCQRWCDDWLDIDYRWMVGKIFDEE